MYYVYAVYNKSVNKFYIGQTKDLKERLKAHNNKIFDKSYTSRYKGLWEVIYTEKLKTREKQLKSYRGRGFIKTYIPR